MTTITTIDALEALYDAPMQAALDKVQDHLTPLYKKWIDGARFLILSTVGPEGTDCSPRGDDGPVVRFVDSKHLAMPDWRGNNRMDSLRNIVRDGRVSLMFMVPGANDVVRVNGQARLTTDAEMRESFLFKGKAPRSVIVIQIGEIYFQCARALMRSRLWAGTDESAGLPSAGDFLAAMTDGEVGGASYDAEWPERAAASMW